MTAERGDFGQQWQRRKLARDTSLGQSRATRQSLAAILTIAHFCDPASELHIEEMWYSRTALEDQLGVPAEKVHTDRLYESLDHLLPHKEAIAPPLRRRFGEHFEPKWDLPL
jgi:hypothetical protein